MIDHALDIWSFKVMSWCDHVRVTSLMFVAHVCGVSKERIIVWSLLVCNYMRRGKVVILMLNDRGTQGPICRVDEVGAEVDKGVLLWGLQGRYRVFSLMGDTIGLISCRHKRGCIFGKERVITTCYCSKGSHCGFTICQVMLNEVWRPHSGIASLVKAFRVLLIQAEGFQTPFIVVSWLPQVDIIWLLRNLTDQITLVLFIVFFL